MSSSPGEVHRDELKALFTDALELPPHRRAAFVERVCGEDLAMRENLSGLLAAYDEASGFFESLSGIVRPNDAAGSRRVTADPYRLTGGTVLHYEILEILDGGGMGVVYKARHRALDRFAALKFLPPHLSSDAEAKSRFLQEARLASTLDHPNICTIYDVAETEEGQLFIAMAYYEGETLKARLSRGPLRRDEAIHIARQTAMGLAAAHERGIVHRDVKPANVMVTSDGDVKLLDFGLAKVANTTVTRAGTMLGTVAYMAPEQASGGQIDNRTDIWALGVVLYEILAGDRPFRAENEQALVHAVLNRPPTTAPDLPRDLNAVIEKCLEKDPSRRYQSMLEMIADLDGPQAAAAVPNTLFLSYQRDADPDEHIASAIAGALADHALTLESEPEKADALVVLISEASAHSELLLAEIESVWNRAPGSRPVIVPVRVDYDEPLAYPLSEYLGEIPALHWTQGSDTSRLASALLARLQGSRSAGALYSTAYRVPSTEYRVPGTEHRVHTLRPAPRARPRLEMPEGTMDPQSAYYIERPEDDVALRGIAQQGVTLTIKGPRQMGKSSLLARTMARASQIGKRIVFLDFQLVDGAALADGDLFFRQFCTWITDELDIENQLEAYWNQPLSSGQRCTRYVGRHILKSVDGPLLLAMDEVERVFDTPFRSDFFSMLRSWHNDRAVKPLWRNLDLALVTSTEPYQLIENLNQSPFNVGEVISLTDFTEPQVEELNARHGGLLLSKHLRTLMDVIGGHPYLIRKSLYLIATNRVSPEVLLTTASEENGPFGDHLRYHLFRLHRQADLVEGVRQVLAAKRCEDEGIFWRLRGAGLVRRTGAEVVMRCRLYEDFFRRHLHE